MKRTNIVIDENLIETGLKVTGLKTQRALVDFALRELLRREAQTRILELRGNIDWKGDLDAMRQTRSYE
ncbi:MAG: type II toxin-antitoxin system VapB family antitoxin [SAR324 cluster bacterium]|nr:type II toxin-antitoxin system VapB family antitoxin [SAR324 cluster bacterium]